MKISVETSCLISSFANSLSSLEILIGFNVCGSKGGGGGSGSSGTMLYHLFGRSSGLSIDFNCFNSVGAKFSPKSLRCWNTI